MGEKRRGDTFPDIFLLFVVFWLRTFPFPTYSVFCVFLSLLSVVCFCYRGSMLAEDIADEFETEK